MATNIIKQYPQNDTSIVGSVDVNVHDGSGNSIGSTAGALNVSGTLSNPSVGTNGAAIPTSSTQVAGSDGTNLRPLKVSAAGVLSIDGSASTQPVSGTVTVIQPTGTNLHAVLDATSTTAVTQATGTNLHTVVDSGSITAVQPTGTNLHTVVDSGTITANIGTTNGLALDASVTGLQVTQGSTTSGQKGDLVQGAVTTAAPTYTTAQTSPLSLTTAGALRTDASGSTQPISGTVTANQGGTWNINNISGTVSLPTGAATEATLATLSLSQGSTTSGEKGPLIQAAVTTAAPSYTTAQTSPLSLTTAGALRTDASATTQPVSGTVTANIGTTNGLALDATVSETHGTKAAGTAATKSDLVGAVFNTSAPSLTNGQQAALQMDSSGNLKTTGTATIAANAAGSGTAATVSTVVTETKPANAVGFILMCIDTSTANIRWALGRTATTAIGQQLQPGRDTGFVPAGVNVSIVAESGTQSYDIQWISSS